MSRKEPVKRSIDSKKAGLKHPAFLPPNIRLFWSGVRGLPPALPLEEDVSLLILTPPIENPLTKKSALVQNCLWSDNSVPPFCETWIPEACFASRRQKISIQKMSRLTKINQSRIAPTITSIKKVSLESARSIPGTRPSHESEQFLYQDASRPVSCQFLKRSNNS